MFLQVGVDSDVNKWITYKTVKNTELSTVFYWFYTVYAQDFIGMSVFFFLFINSVWISKMWVFYVDIYVNKNKNFFFCEKAGFLRHFTWHYGNFFIQSRCCFPIYRNIDSKIELPFYKRLKKGGAFPWRWHFSPRSVHMPGFTGSEREWVQRVEEKF